MFVHVSAIRRFYPGVSRGFLQHGSHRQSSVVPFYFVLPFLLLGWSLPGHTACGETISAITQELIQEEHALRATIQTVRSSKARVQTFDADLQTLLADPSLTYDKALARRLATLRQREVEPKRRTLENLRAQHEESRQQWEHGHQQLAPQLAEARTAYQANTMTHDELCRVRATYAHALRLYLRGMQDYRRGMELYTRALDEYADRFVSPYIKGVTNPRYWEELVIRLERGDFLHDILVPMTANAIRGVPPEAPPG